MPRYQPLGSLGAGPGSRATLALSLPDARGALPAPCVLVYLPDDVRVAPEAMESVRRETRRAAQLEHPNIVKVFGLDEQPGSAARVVEYADGESLRAILDLGGKLSPALAARIAADAALGIHYAHVAGNDDGTPLVHGDVRPETLLVSYSGVTKVAGYGALAVAPREAGGLRVKGRRHHCAPEQVVGGRGAVNVQTDVYLLGVLLYELLSCAVPFAHLGNEFDTAVLTYPPPPLPVGERPAALEAVVRRAMAKKAFDRYPTALAFREALEKAMGALVSHDEVAKHLAVLFPKDQPGPRLTREKMMEAALLAARAALSGPQEIAAVQGARAQRAPAGPAQPTAPARPLAEAAPASAPPPPPSSRAEPAATSPEADAADPSPAPQDAPEPIAEEDSAPPARRRSAASVFAAVAVGVVVALGALWWAGVLQPFLGGEIAQRGPVAKELADAGAPLAQAPAPIEDAGPEQASSPVAPDAGSGLAQLDVSVDPVVQVSLDGEDAGRSPLKAQVSVGRHVLRFVDPAKGINTARAVEVPPEGASRSYYLTRGFVVVSAPDGAEVFIDGRSAGKAPLRELGLYEGSHRILVDVDGAKWQQSFELGANQRVRFDVDFE